MWIINKCCWFPRKLLRGPHKTFISSPRPPKLKPPFDSARMKIFNPRPEFGNVSVLAAANTRCGFFEEKRLSCYFYTHAYSLSPWPEAGSHMRWGVQEKNIDSTLLKKKGSAIPWSFLHLYEMFWRVKASIPPLWRAIKKLITFFFSFFLLFLWSGCLFWSPQRPLETCLDLTI